MRISKFLMAKVGEAECIPMGYGLAYWDYARAEGIFYLIPLNLLARFGLWLYWTIAYGFYPNKFERKLQDERSKGQMSCWDTAYRDGYESGKRDGYSKGWKGCAEETNKRLDQYLAMTSEERKTFKGWD